MSKYIKIKEIIFYSIFFLILYFVLRDLKELVEFYQFDTNASDLTADGVSLRNSFFSSSYDPAVMYRAIIDYTILLLPSMIVVALYKYNKIKNKSFKYLIGKSRSINKYLLTFLPVVFFYVVLLAYTVVCYILTRFKVRKGANFDDFVPENNIFSFVNGPFFGYIVLLVIFTGMYIFFTTMLLITLIDYGYNYIYLIIAYILSLYVVSDFLKMYISRSLGIEGSISWFSGVAFSNIQMFISFIYMGIIYLLFKLTHKKEF